MSAGNSQGFGFPGALTHVLQLFAGLPAMKKGLLMTAAIGASIAVYVHRTRQVTSEQGQQQCDTERSQDEFVGQQEAQEEEKSFSPDERDQQQRLEQAGQQQCDTKLPERSQDEFEGQQGAQEEEKRSSPEERDPQPERLAELVDRSRLFLENVSGFLRSKRVLDATAEEVLPHKWMEMHPSFADKELMVQKNLHGERVRTIDELLEVANVAKPIFDNLLHKMVCASGLDPERTVTDKHGQPVMLTHSCAFKVLTLAPLKSVERLVEKVSNELGGDFSKAVDVVRCSVVVFTEEELEKVAQFLKRAPGVATEEGKVEERHNNNDNHAKSSSLSYREDEEKKRSNSSYHPYHPEYEVVRLKNRFKEPLFNGYRDALYNIVVHCDDSHGKVTTHVCEVQLHLADIVAHKEGTHVFYEYFRTYFSGSRAEASRMQALEKIEGACGGSVDQMIGSILCGSNLEQLNHLAYLIEDLMGDVKIALLIWKRIVELNDADLSKTLISRSNYGRALVKAGKLSEAETVLRKVRSDSCLVLGNSHENTLASINNLAMLLHAQGKMTEAETLHREALDGRRQVLGNSHPSTLISINNLAVLLHDQGKLTEAELLHRESLDGRRQVLGNSHPDTLISINNLAVLLKDQGKLTETEPLHREALDGHRQLLGNSHPDTLTLISNLAALLHGQGKMTEAEPLYRESLDRRRQLLGNSHPDTLISINHLAVLLKDQGKLTEAEPFCRESLDGRRQVLGNSHPDTLTSINNLAVLFRAQGKLTEAETCYKEALDGRRQVLGNSHPDTLISISNFASLLRDQGKMTEAEPLHREVLDGRRQVLGNSHPSTLSSINNLAVFLHDQGKLTEAETLHREALDGRRQVLGNSHPSTLISINNFAALLHDQGKLTEAEPLQKDVNAYVHRSRTQARYL